MTDAKKGVDGAIGHRKPPVGARFKKGQSGNPRGRPPGRHRDLPYEAVLGRMVTIRENGESRRGTAAEAFLLQMATKGVEGDVAAGKLALAAIAEARARRAQNLGHISHLITVIVSPNHALESLRMARKLDRFGETPRMALEPWIVEAALARLGKRRFTRGEQEAIVRATRTPRQVRWPPWWEVMP